MIEHINQIAYANIRTVKLFTTHTFHNEVDDAHLCSSIDLLSDSGWGGADLETEVN